MHALAADYVELGFRSLKRNGFKGGCAYTTDSFIERLDVPEDMRLGVMVNAAELVGYPDGAEGALSELFKPAAESPLTLVRIACHMPEFETALQGASWLREQGYVVSVNLMQISDRSEDEIRTAAGLARMYKPNVLYLADSMGGLDAQLTSRIITTLRHDWDGPLGIHAHDNMGRALANSMHAISEGVQWIDGTVTGMGRGPGNVKTEYLAIELAAHRGVSSNITPLLDVIDRHFQPMKDEYGWGTNTYYYLAGKYGIHPTYIQEMISDSRYDDEDYLAIIEHLRKVGGKKFSVRALETGREFYSGEPRGEWKPASLIEGREVLVVGAGPGAARHQQALEIYINAAKPVVVALNTQDAIGEKYIDIRAASHPFRLLADCEDHLSRPQPLATPASMLPDSVRASLEGKELLDYGLLVQADTFHFDEEFCILPTSLVIAYALAIAASGRASRVLLAGFDGYGADDPRTAEMDRLLSGYQKTRGVPPLVTITPSRYKLPSTSVYALI